ncbi:uncharacterized protein LOC142986706 [Anticarsia gemmatalis]|uniref:uncharacterized protein LOC142986706 n=1 Tax=Anticarsia gemmatalis TaxID=129554 RepID=UPI003F75E6D9
MAKACAIPLFNSGRRRRKGDGTRREGKGAVPGLFFWKPRLGLDLSIPTTELSITVLRPTKDNIRMGMVVILEGYQAGMTVIGLASGLTSGPNYPHLNPLSAYYYTHTYRWALRYISLIPFWLSGKGGHFCDTHKVWTRRFYYMDEFVPDWIKAILFYVSKDEWAKEQKEFVRFKKYAEAAFGKHFRYPGKVFNDFKSQLTKETIENLDRSSISIDVG